MENILPPWRGKKYQPMSFGGKNMKRPREKGGKCKRKRKKGKENEKRGKKMRKGEIKGQNNYKIGKATIIVEKLHVARGGKNIIFRRGGNKCRFWTEI